MSLANLINVRSAAASFCGVQRVIPLLIAFLLAFTAGLKTHSIAEDGHETGSLFLWMFVGVVGWEILLAAALISGFRSRTTRRIALATFFVFAAVSLVKFVRGDATCGCFGFVQFAPWVALLVDLFVIVALTRWQVDIATELIWKICNEKSRRAVAICAALFVAGSAWWLSARYQDHQSQSQLSVLQEMQSQLADAFPFDLRQGEWEVAILKSSCPACQLWLQQQQNLRDAKHPRLAVILVDDFATATADADISEIESPSSVVVVTCFTEHGLANRLFAPVVAHFVHGKIVSLRSSHQLF